MARAKAAYFGMGFVAGCAATALFFLFKEGLIFVGDGGSVTIHDEVAVDKHEDSEPIPFKDTPKAEPSEHVAYNAIVTGLGYQAEERAPVAEAPYRISSDDYYDEYSEYESTELTLYGDEVVADSVTDNVLSPEDLASALGSNWTKAELRRSLELGPDVLCIRNERLSTQYEITFNDKTYEEVTGQLPYE